MQACAQALLLAPDDAERDRLLASLVRETGRAGRVIASLLRLARLDEGQPMVREPCDLVALCADEADRTWTLAPQLEVLLRADDLGRDQPQLDAEAVREIVANLLDNARRHAAGNIEVLIGATDGDIEVKVVDDGPGLAEDLRERAFERFVSVDGQGGAGLGLAIARSLARAHGGDVTYEGGGFLLRLPALEAVDEGPPVTPK